MLVRNEMSLGALVSRARAKFSRLHYSMRVQHHQRVREAFNKKVRIEFPRLAREMNLYKAKSMVEFRERTKAIFRRLLPKGAMLNFKMVPEVAESDADMLADVVAEMAVEAGEEVVAETRVVAAARPGAEVATEVDEPAPHIDHRSESGVLHVKMTAPTKGGQVRLEFDLALLFFSQVPSDTGLQTVDIIRETLFHNLQTAAKNWE